MKILKEKQIKKLCKKHPQWKDVFLSYLENDENLSINELEKTFSLILKHKSIFKNLIHDAKSFSELNDNRSVLERLNDKVTFDINEHKKNQIINLLNTKKNQFINLLNRLLEYPRADPSKYKNIAISLDSYNGHMDVFNRLLDDPKFDPSDDNNSAICLASRNGDIDLVNRLLEDSRVDPSDNNNFPICLASYNGHMDVVNRLLEDQRVCETLDKDWIKENLNKDQLEIYKNTLSMIKYHHENTKRKTNKPIM